MCLGPQGIAMRLLRRPSHYVPGRIRSDGGGIRPTSVGVLHGTAWTNETRLRLALLSEEQEARKHPCITAGVH